VIAADGSWSVVSLSDGDESRLRFSEEGAVDCRRESDEKWT
jgi:hypothetical protein